MCSLLYWYLYLQHCTIKPEMELPGPRNQTLTQELELSSLGNKIQLFVFTPSLCDDNKQTIHI